MAYSAATDTSAVIRGWPWPDGVVPLVDVDMADEEIGAVVDALTDGDPATDEDVAVLLAERSRLECARDRLMENIKQAQVALVRRALRMDLRLVEAQRLAINALLPRH